MAKTEQTQNSNDLSIFDAVLTALPLEWASGSLEDLQHGRMTRFTRAFLKLVQHADPQLYHALEPILSAPTQRMETHVIDRIHDRLASADFRNKCDPSGRKSSLSRAIEDDGWSD